MSDVGRMLMLQAEQLQMAVVMYNNMEIGEARRQFGLEVVPLRQRLSTNQLVDLNDQSCMFKAHLL